MAGKGPPPKDPSTRRRQNKTTVTRVESDTERRGPELPFGIDWPAQTRIWWENWRRSAQASTFLETDWDFLLDTAVLHAAFWSGSSAVAGEIRLRVAKFGATPEDRLRLGLRIEDGKELVVETESPYQHLRVVADVEGA